ncbi:MAG: hypothetical protein OES57_01740 [Acidimicrobiia bacterium]|nr:hypothetical protein [Acidimicrobiia bacterium]
MFDTGYVDGALASLTLVEPVTLARDQVVPTLDALGGLFPDGGLARGSLVDVRSRAGGARSLALALSAAVTQQGGWAVHIGLPGLDLATGAELGVALERTALVDRPAPEHWATVVAAVIGAFEVVVVGAPPRLRPTDLRRLQARARERGSVLVVVGGTRRTEALRHEADLRLLVDGCRWHGLGHGHGYLQARSIEVAVEGRRRAARPRQVTLWLPGSDGRVQAVVHDDRHAGSDIDALVDARPLPHHTDADIVPFPSTG